MDQATRLLCKLRGMGWCCLCAERSPADSTVHTEGWVWWLPVANELAIGERLAAGWFAQATNETGLDGLSVLRAICAQSNLCCQLLGSGRKVGCVYRLNATQYDCGRDMPTSNTRGN